MSSSKNGKNGSGKARASKECLPSLWIIGSDFGGPDSAKQNSSALGPFVAKIQERYEEYMADHGTRQTLGDFSKRYASAILADFESRCKAAVRGGMRLEALMNALRHQQGYASVYGMLPGEEQAMVSLFGYYGRPVADPWGWLSYWEQTKEKLEHVLFGRPNPLAPYRRTNLGSEELDALQSFMAVALSLRSSNGVCNTWLFLHRSLAFGEAALLTKCRAFFDCALGFPRRKETKLGTSYRDKHSAAVSITHTLDVSNRECSKLTVEQHKESAKIPKVAVVCSAFQSGKSEMELTIVDPFYHGDGQRKISVTSNTPGGNDLQSRTFLVGTTTDCQTDDAPSVESWEDNRYDVEAVDRFSESIREAIFVDPPTKHSADSVLDSCEDIATILDWSRELSKWSEKMQSDKLDGTIDPRWYSDWKRHRRSNRRSTTQSRRGGRG